MYSQMDRQKSVRDDVRKRRLRRKNFILAVFNLFKRLWNWILCVVTFKKTIIVFCLFYFVRFVSRREAEYEAFGMPFPVELATVVVSVLIGQLALTALSSLGSRVVDGVKVWSEAKETQMESKEIITEDSEDYG